MQTWNGKSISNLTALLPVLLIAGFACQQRPVTPITQTLKWDGPQFRVLKEEARQLYKKGNLMQAALLYKDGAELAKKDKDPVSQARFLNNVGAIHLAVLDYRAAVEAYDQALVIAESIDDQKTVRSSRLMLASVYLQHGDLESASNTALKAEAELEGGEQARYTSNVYLQRGQIEARKDNWVTAEKYFHKAIAAAAMDGDATLEAFAWDQLGYERLEKGLVEQAEPALLEAFRLRRLSTGQAEICLSYTKLGILRSKQKQFPEALRWLNLAAAGCPSFTTMQSWILYRTRGQTLQALNRPALALADLRTAIGFIRRWKLEVIPIDGLRAPAEEELQQVYDVYLSMVSAEAIRTGDKNLVWESFLTAQENHAWSFRELKRQAQTKMGRQLPEDYYSTLEKLRETESLIVSSNHTPVLDSRVAGLRLRLQDLEMRAGLGDLKTLDQPAENIKQELQASLHKDEAIVSFHVAAESSCVWVLTRNSISLYPLLENTDLAAEVSSFVDAIRADIGTERFGKKLFTSLLGDVYPKIKDRKNLLLILDRSLFGLPFAALPAGGSGRYLIEDHTLQVIPSISMATEPIAKPSHGFLGLGDAIYNRADNRLLRSAQLPAIGRPLNRLPGTAQELERCAKAFQSDGPVQVLTGSDATPKVLQQALTLNPQVVHIAAHFMKEAHSEPALALSLNPQGVPAMITSKEAATFKTNAQLVTLNGCGSGDGSMRPGSGLMGLTRAWLAAGAQTTIASHWPTPDDGGEMFVRLYEQIGLNKKNMTSHAIAEALRESQLASLRSGSYRNRPKYWSAFFVVGKGRT